MKRILPVLLAALALAALPACKDSMGPSGTPLTALSISPSPLFLGVGDTTHLTAIGTKSDGSKIDVTPQYKSSNTGVATVDANGLVTGKAVGTATITAKSGGQTQTVEVQVLDSGSFRTFNVNANDAPADQCDVAINHAARLVATSAHAIVYEDRNNPTGGFTAADYQSILAEFESIVWPTDSLNFGNPSDLDGNHKVIILYTRAVNDLTPAGANFVVGGFFYGRDLFPKTEQNGLQACPTSNVAEMFYMLAPDPTGASNGHIRTKDYVREGTVATIGHELQHLINASRRLYVNDAPVFEDVWLDEGLAHTAEELNFFTARGLGPRQNLGQSQVFATQAQVNTFIEFDGQNFGRFAEYLGAPAANSPYADNDDLATRGATWNFLRYTADRRAGNDQQYWFALVNSQTAGLANLQAVLGTDPVLWARDWTVAVYTDDVVPTTSVFQQPSWNFRDIYSNPGFGGYPLQVQTLANTSYNLAIKSGSAAFLKFGAAAGQQADLRFIQAGGGAVGGTCTVQNLAVGASVQVILGAAGAALCFPGAGEYVAVPFHASNTQDLMFNLSVTAANVVAPTGPPSPNRVPARLFSLDGQSLSRPYDGGFERGLREREHALMTRLARRGGPRLDVSNVIGSAIHLTVVRTK
jgi:hypothetical protein